MSSPTSKINSSAAKTATTRGESLKKASNSPGGLSTGAKSYDLEIELNHELKASKTKTYNTINKEKTFVVSTSSSPRMGDSVRSTRDHSFTSPKPLGDAYDLRNKFLQRASPKLTTHTTLPGTPRSTCSATNRSIADVKRSTSSMSCKRNQAPKFLGTKSPKIEKVVEKRGLSAHERCAVNNRIKAFEALAAKLEDLQSQFVRKFENLKGTSGDKMESEYKFITIIKNNECKLLVKDEDLQKLPKRLPIHSMSDLKNTISNAFNECMASVIESIQTKIVTKDQEASSMDVGDIRDNLETVTKEKVSDIFVKIKTFMEPSSLDDAVGNVKKELQKEEAKCLKTLEPNFQDIKTREEKLRKLEQDISNKFNADIRERDTKIRELLENLKGSEAKVQKLEVNISKDIEAISNAQKEKDQLLAQMNAINTKAAVLDKKLIKMERELNEATSVKEQLTQIAANLERQFETEREKLSALFHKQTSQDQIFKETNEKNLTKIQDLRDALSVLEMENQELKSLAEQSHTEYESICELKTKLGASITAVQDLEITVSCQKSKIVELSDTLNKYITEIGALRKSDGQKEFKIEALQKELKAASLNYQALEKQLQQDSQVLKVRSDAINSLQQNDSVYRVQVEELSVKLKDRTIALEELTMELKTKEEEFNNLFTTLTNKQMEFSRQEHVMKLLEETNERNQIMRLNQEERVCRLEEEITSLRRTLLFYQNSLLGSSNCKNILFAPVSPPSEEIESNPPQSSREEKK